MIIIRNRKGKPIELVLSGTEKVVPAHSFIEVDVNIADLAKVDTLGQLDTLMRDGSLSVEEGA